MPSAGALQFAVPPVFSHRIEVRFRDCDSFRHVNNAVYLTYFEQARIVMGETLGWRRALDEAGVSLILAHASCDYKAQLVFGDEVEIRASIVGIGRRSFTSQFDAHRVRDDALAARGRSVQAVFDYAAGKTASIPDALREKLEAMLTTAPAGA